MQLRNSTAIVPRTLKVITKMANPIADSAAATVRTNKANNWPIISSKETENTKKFKLTANNINSIDINIIRRFRRLRRIPQIPKRKMIIENVKYLIGSIEENRIDVREIQIMWGLTFFILCSWLWYLLTFRTELSHKCSKRRYQLATDTSKGKWRGESEKTMVFDVLYTQFLYDRKTQSLIADQ